MVRSKHSLSSQDLGKNHSSIGPLNYSTVDVRRLNLTNQLYDTSLKLTRARGNGNLIRVMFLRCSILFLTEI